MFSLYWIGIVVCGGIVVAVWNHMYPRSSAGLSKAHRSRYIAHPH